MSDGAMRAAVFAALGKRVFYGWTILAVAGLGIFATGPGQSHTFSVFVGPIGADLGLSKASISSAYGLATLLAAFCLPYMGRLLGRFGPRGALRGVRRGREPALARRRLRGAALPRAGLADADLRQPGLAVVQPAARVRAEPHGPRLRGLDGRASAARPVPDRDDRLAPGVGR